MENSIFRDIRIEEANEPQKTVDIAKNHPVWFT